MEHHDACQPNACSLTKVPVTQANLTRHVLVCTGSACRQNQSEATLEAFWKVLKERGLLYGKRGSLEGSILVSTSGSIGLCAVGPAVMVYPEGIWYYGVQPEDVEQIVDEHLIGDQPVERLLAYTFK